MIHLKKFNENLEPQEVLGDIKNICLELIDMDKFSRQIQVKVEEAATNGVYIVEINMYKIKYDQIKEVLLGLKDYILNYLHKTMSVRIYQGYRIFPNCGVSEQGVYHYKRGDKIYYTKHITDNISNIVIAIQ